MFSFKLLKKVSSQMIPVIQRKLSHVQGLGLLGTATGGMGIRLCSTVQKNMIETYLNLEKIDVNIFRSQVLTGTVTRQVYGGQVIGQSMVAAGKTVEDLFHLHSLHCYFIRKGTIDVPILYIVNRVRDGRSFSTRYVEAIQDGHKVFACEMSFAKEEPHLVNHQPQMPPDVPPPEELMDVSTLIHSFMAQAHLLNDAQRAMMQKLDHQVNSTDWSVDVRPADPGKFVRLMTSWDGQEMPKMLTWVKSSGIQTGNDPRLQHCAAAYISDMFMVTTALQPIQSRGTKVGITLSLDHSMWFHQYRFRMDDWVLFETECPAASFSRSLVFGRMYTRAGELILSCSQEGLIRQAKD